MTVLNTAVQQKQNLRTHIRWMVRRDMPEVVNIEKGTFSPNKIKLIYEEIWKAVCSFTDYEVSNLGSIRSLNRVKEVPHPKKASVIQQRHLKGRVLKQSPDSDGYMTVGLCRDGISFTKKVARLVLEAFVGPCPEKHEACHFPDQDRTNNNIENLVWGTHADNRRHQDLHGTSLRGERHWNTTLTQNEVDTIKIRLANGERQNQIAGDYGVRPQVINNIATGRNWNTITMRGTPWIEEDFLRCLRQRNCIGMVAEQGDRVIGYMIYELHKFKLHILNFAVHPSYRRAGVGTQMVAKLISKLSNHRRTRITLELREINLDAQLFFHKQKYKAVNVLRSFYEDSNEDVYLMQYKLQD